jgi:hypothetical protein
VEGFVFEIFGLHLQRQVIDAETVVEFDAQHLEQFGLHHRRRVDDVRAQGFASRSDRPDVQVVDALDAFGRADGLLDRREVDVRGRAFQQNVRGFLDEMPRTPDDQERDGRAKQRIRLIPTIHGHQHARDDRADRPERVAHDVQPRAVDV